MHQRSKKMRKNIEKKRRSIRKSWKMKNRLNEKKSSLRNIKKLIYFVYIFAKNAYIYILYLTIYVSYSIWIIRYMNSIKRVRPFLVLMISRVILKRISEISNEWSHTMRQNELSIEFIDEYMYWVIHMIHSRWRIRFFVLHISALIQCSVEKEWYSNIAKR